MIRRPPRSTLRKHTLSYTTLFRSRAVRHIVIFGVELHQHRQILTVQRTYHGPMMISELYEIIERQIGLHDSIIVRGYDKKRLLGRNQSKFPKVALYAARRVRNPWQNHFWCGEIVFNEVGYLVQTPQGVSAAVRDRSELRDNIPEDRGRHAGGATARSWGPRIRPDVWPCR